MPNPEQLVAGMTVLRALRVWEVCFPGENRPYRIVAALISEWQPLPADVAWMKERIGELRSTIRHCKMDEVGEGILPGALHALQALDALCNPDPDVYEVNRHADRAFHAIRRLDAIR